MSCFANRYFIFVWVAFSCIVATTQAEERTDIRGKVGIIAPLTGSMASFGENIKKGAVLAFESLNADRSSQIRLFFEDNGSQPARTVTAFHKLATVEKVRYLICAASVPCNAIAPLAEQAGIIQFAIASDPAIPHGKKYVFRFHISLATEGEMILKMLKENSAQRIGAIVAAHDGIETGHSRLTADSFYTDRQIAKYSVPPDEDDFRTPLTKLIALRPDWIFLGLLPGYAGECARQARTLGYEGRFFGFSFIEGDESLVLANGALEHTIFTNIAEPDAEFRSSFSRRFDSDPGDGASQAYDAIRLISAIDHGETPTSLAQSLEKLTNFKGVMGTYGALPGHEFSIPVALKTVEHGRFAFLEHRRITTE